MLIYSLAEPSQCSLSSLLIRLMFLDDLFEVRSQQFADRRASFRSNHSNFSKSAASSLRVILVFMRPTIEQYYFT